MLRIMTLVALLVLITLLGATKALGWVPEGRVRIQTVDTVCDGSPYSPFACILDIRQGVVESQECNLGIAFVGARHTISINAEDFSFIELFSKNKNQQLFFNTRTLRMFFVNSKAETTNKPQNLSKAHRCTASYYYYDEKEIK